MLRLEILNMRARSVFLLINIASVATGCSIDAVTFLPYDAAAIESGGMGGEGGPDVGADLGQHDGPTADTAADVAGEVPRDAQDAGSDAGANSAVDAGAATSDGDSASGDSSAADSPASDAGDADSPVLDAGGGMGGSAGGAGELGGMGAGGSRPAMITASASSMDFGQVEIGVQQSPRTWTVTNNGDLSTSPLTFSDASTTDIIATNNCPSTLLGGARCTITVAVKPSTAAPINGTLQVGAAQGGAVSLAVTATAGVRLTVTTSGTGTVTSIPAGIACGATCSALFDSGAAVTVQARTTNGSDFFFSGWSGGGCAGTGRDCQIAMGTTAVATLGTFAPMSSNLIFVSSGTFPPDRGSAAAYDQDCNNLATAAGVNDASGGAFTAVTSDAASTVLTRLGTGSGWIRMDGRPFSDSADGLFRFDRVFNSIRYTERGEDAGTSTIVMTGTFPSGTASDNCLNWTTTAGNASFLPGNADGGPERWTGVAIAHPTCDSGPFRIICMGHGKAVPVTPMPASGRLIWLSNGLYFNGNPMAPVPNPPDQVCQSEKPAGVTTAAALLAYSDRGPSALLSATTNYVRVDGILVGSGAQLGTADTLESGIWQSANGAYRVVGLPAGGVMTGGPGGSLFNTCGDWTSINVTGVSGDYGVTTAGSWWNTSPLRSCNAIPTFIYCVQTAP